MCKLNAFLGVKTNKQVQVDWNETDENSVSYIKNRNIVVNKLDALARKDEEVNGILVNQTNLINDMSRGIQANETAITELSDSLNTKDSELRESIDALNDSIAKTNSIATTNKTNIATMKNSVDNAFVNKAVVGYIPFNEDSSEYVIQPNITQGIAGAYQLADYTNLGDYQYIYLDTTLLSRTLVDDGKSCKIEYILGGKNPYFEIEVRDESNLNVMNNRGTRIYDLDKTSYTEVDGLTTTIDLQGYYLCKLTIEGIPCFDASGYYVLFNVFLEVNKIAD